MIKFHLPAGWQYAKIEDILELQEDGKLIHQGWSPQCDSTSADVEEWGVLKTTAIQDGIYLDYENKRLPKNKVPKTRIEVKNGDLLITNAGPRTRCGVICLVKDTRKHLMISGKMYRLRFPNSLIDNRFVESWLRTSYAQKELNDRKTGINESGLNMTQSRFLSLPIVVAPFAEQKVIANKLDSLLEKSHTLKTRIEKIPNILNRLRQSVLTAAINGKLTEAWRIQNQSEKWKTVSLFDVIESKPRNGYSPRRAEYKTAVKNLTLSAVTKGFFIENCFKYVDIDVPHDSYLWVKNNDILIQRANSIEYVGISAIYEGTDDKYIYPDLMMKIHANEKIHTKFLHYSLLSDETRGYFRKNASGTTGNMPKINQITVAATPIHLPSLLEQFEIVRRVEKLFTQVDYIEEKINTALKHINSLKPSLLAKAFRGELSEEWRAENPDSIKDKNSATALLEKIKTQRLEIIKKSKVKKNKKIQKEEPEKKEVITENPVLFIIEKHGVISPQELFDELKVSRSLDEILNEVSQLIDNKLIVEVFVGNKKHLATKI